MVDVLADHARVAPELAALLRAMRDGRAPIGVVCARAAIAGLESGHLRGLQTSSRRALVPGAEGAPAVEHGAIFQARYRRAAPRDESDVEGWVITEDGFRGGAVVLAHELTHYRARWVTYDVARSGARLVDPSVARGVDKVALGWVRAQLLNEIAARHVAYLLEGATSPEEGLPAEGALFACAVKIASYPHVYNDDAVMPALLARGDRALLRDQVGAWLAALDRFPFFLPGTAMARAHGAWLAREIALASRGRAAPEVDAEGTI